MVGVVEQVGADVTSVKPGDRVTVNVETFCGECFFCGMDMWITVLILMAVGLLGCRIDGGQAEYVRVPYADQGLNRIPDTVSDEQALFVGDVLATGFLGAYASRKLQGGILFLSSVPDLRDLYFVVCDAEEAKTHYYLWEISWKIRFVREHYPDVLVTEPENCKEFVLKNSDHGGADVVWKWQGVTILYLA